jgi:hypothetical protein
LGQPAQEEKSAEESQQVRESVPTNAKVLAELDHERTEIIEVICNQGGKVEQATNDAEQESFLAKRHPGQFVTT